MSLGMQNSRMKDFYDLWAMARQFGFEGDVLASAIRNTFDRRKTALPAAAPVAMPNEFSADSGKQKQWASFLAKSGLEAPPLSDAAEQIEAFLSPPGLVAARAQSFHARGSRPAPGRKPKVNSQHSGSQPPRRVDHRFSACVHSPRPISGRNDRLWAEAAGRSVSLGIASYTSRSSTVHS